MRLVLRNRAILLNDKTKGGEEIETEKSVYSHFFFLQLDNWVGFNSYVFYWNRKSNIYFNPWCNDHCFAKHSFKEFEE